MLLLSSSNPNSDASATRRKMDFRKIESIPCKLRRPIGQRHLFCRESARQGAFTATAHRFSTLLSFRQGGYHQPRRKMEKRRGRGGPTAADVAEFKRIFARPEGDPKDIGARIRQETPIDDAHLLKKERTRKAVSIARRPPRGKTYPPSLYHTETLWAVQVGDDFFYGLVLYPSADMVVPGSSVAHLTMITYGVEPVFVVGHTYLEYHEVFDAISKIATAFGVKDGPHTLYWHAIDFLKTAAEAVCAADGGCAWDAVDLDEATVRAGLFSASARACYDAQNFSPSDATSACARTRSAAHIRSHWPPVIDPERDAIMPLCLLS
ncbi:hypothetical protein pqer_cds_1011 [Pandoravirus quercus]|uniref:Uncharacterized protein n=1 Tax=Pandoravirus quercus TaxID=2107709 RepID=A0A2U7UAG5_9VIRU|nr:hypothetical protein pqer_cds_1011 [Pandoravirus quercus]AVK75433.1 hypothetical protein pqer_cds_1011 [Pandoravirus quercus]